MGYSIRIGEYKTEKDEVYRDFPAIPEIYLDSAPADGSPTDYTNARWPSYSAWADFTKSTRLTDVFNELMANHPGIAVLKPEHLARFKAVKTSRLADYNKNRLAWLIFWTEYALTHCKRPAISNT